MRTTLTEALRKILDGTIDDLEESLLTECCDEQTALTAQMRRDYLLGETERLEQLAAVSPVPLEHLVRLKLAIRTGKGLEDARKSYSRAPFPEENILAAEAAVTLAIAAEQMGNDLEAESLYQSAYKLCRTYGLKRRAASVYHNIVACRSRIYPRQRFIYEYNRAVRLAMECDAFHVAGTALANLAREYQRAGALDVASDTINRAVNLLREKQFGSYQYFFALCDRCDISLERGFVTDAERDFNEARIARFPEIRAAAQHLARRAALLGHMWSAQNSSKETPATAWRGRVEEDLQRLSSNLGLSVLEERLFASLLEKPAGFLELVDQVYPESFPFETKENRLKQLIHRVRRKWPDLICHRSGKYQIASNRA